MWKLVALFAVLTMSGLALVGVGSYELHRQDSGQHATASVDDCHYSYGGGKTTNEICTGSWLVGGSSLLSGGHFVFGRVDGATSDDIGKKLLVRVHGDTAYKRDRTTAYGLIGIGAFIALTFVFGGISMARPDKSTRQATSTSS